MSTGDHVWSIITELSTALDGDRDHSEQTLDGLQSELRLIPRSARDDLRRQMIQIVAALSRLEVRLIDSDGPLPTVI
jgi:hypothetical protein